MIQQVKGIQQIAVAGGGVLGSQIAFQSAYQGYPVRIWLRSEASIDRAKKKITYLKKVYLDTLEQMKDDANAYAYGLLEREQLSEQTLEACKQRVEEAADSLVLSTSYEDVFSKADLIIEAIAENPEEKCGFYQKLNPYLKKNAILCTNSSTLLPSMFTKVIEQPERYLALHFANKIWKMPTAEVMAHDKTDPQYVETVMEFAQSIRMVPVRVQKEHPGYLLNSLLVPLLKAAQMLWAEGIGSVEDIDRVWRMSTGAPQGPFQILDVVGLTTAYNITQMNPEVKNPASTAAKISRLLKEKIDRGETGVLAGKGFYDYTE